MITTSALPELYVAIHLNKKDLSCSHFVWCVIAIKKEKKDNLNPPTSSLEKTNCNTEQLIDYILLKTSNWPKDRPLLKIAISSIPAQRPRVACWSHVDPFMTNKKPRVDACLLKPHFGFIWQPTCWNVYSFYPHKTSRTPASVQTNFSRPASV